jgi:hypothetical protein
VKAPEPARLDTLLLLVNVRLYCGHDSHDLLATATANPAKPNTLAAGHCDL